MKDPCNNCGEIDCRKRCEVDTRTCYEKCENAGYSHPLLNCPCHSSHSEQGERKLCTRCAVPFVGNCPQCGSSNGYAVQTEFSKAHSEDGWRERFDQKFLKDVDEPLGPSLKINHGTLSFIGELEAFIASELASAEARGRAEERERVFAIIKEHADKIFDPATTIDAIRAELRPNPYKA